MELKLLILSLACFSCMVPPALSTSLLAAKAAAVGAGALVAKGLAVKGAALLCAKVVAAKIAAAKGAALAAAVAKPVVEVEIPQSTVVITPPRLSNIVDRFSSLLGVAHAAAVNKTAAVGELLAAFLPSKTVVKPVPPPPKPLPIILQPVIVSKPDCEVPPTIAKLAPPPAPSVAIIGPTMNVNSPHDARFYPLPLFEKVVKK